MFNAKDIIEATSGQPVCGRPDASFLSVSTDTRKIERGALFVAIKGPNFDGHDFIGQAMEKGASGAVVSADVACGSPGFSVFRVSDTVKALGDLAKFHRKRFDIPVIALTGSNGKTTTKEMLAAVLSSKYKVLKNGGTENNSIGVPQTLLRLTKEDEIAVVELGTNHFGEIAYLADIAGPNCGIILNVGPSHLEYFGTVDGVRSEKLDLLKRICDDGSVIVNGDDEALVSAAEKLCEEVVTFGFSEGCDFMAGRVRESDCGIDFSLNDTYMLKLRMIGRHNIYNALAALAAGSLYGVETGEAVGILEGFVPPKLRMEYARCDGIDFIFDCYNSNPLSMRSAIDTLRDMGTGRRKVVVAGDMLELGVAAPEMHREVGRLAARAKVDILVSVGSLSGYILEGAQEEGIGGEALLHFENSAEAAKALKDILREGDLVLVKGSRGMKMEEIKKCFTTCSTR